MQNNLKQDAFDWWDNLTDEQKEAHERKAHIYGHDIGTTEQDVIDMYKDFLNDK